MNSSNTAKAIEQLEQLVTQGYSPTGLDQILETLKLLGLVLGYQALVETAISEPIEKGDLAAKVNAAKTLVQLKEDPVDIAERLRRSRFSSMTVDQLHTLVNGLKQNSLTSLIAIQGDPNGSSQPPSV